MTSVPERRGPEGRSVSHRTGRDEEGGLEAEDLGRPLSRRVISVLAVDVVADLGSAMARRIAASAA